MNAILVDVGNTTIKVCLASPRERGPVYAVPTSRTETADSLGLTLEAICRRHGVERIERVVASSVVPPLDPVVRQAADRFWGCPAHFVLQDIPIPLENRYSRPQEVGADRLLAAWSARCLEPSPTLIVVDFGTATTFDCVHGATYLGGLIAPGIASSVSALATQTAKLPHIDLDGSETVMAIGTSTRQSMNHGVLFGFAAMVEGLTHRLRKLLQAPDAVVMATGGFAPVIARRTDAIQRLVPELILEGLHRLAFSPLSTHKEEA